MFRWYFHLKIEKNSNNYGRIEIYCILEEQLVKIETLNYGKSLISINWDPSGRFFLVICTDTYRLIDSKGQLLCEERVINKKVYFNLQSFYGDQGIIQFWTKEN